MIPRRCSFFWTGRMSWLRYLTLWSFRKYNPDWEMVLYSPALDPPTENCVASTWNTGEDADRLYTGGDWRGQVGTLGVQLRTWNCPIPRLLPAHESDLLAWYVLSTSGGWYCDMDVLWIDSMDPTHRSVEGADAVFCLEAGYLAVGLLASNPECELFRDVMTSASVGSTYQNYGTELLYRVAGRLPHDSRPDGIRALECLRKKHPVLAIVEVPDEIVYPFDWRQIEDLFVRRSPVPKSVGVHWFGGSKLAQQYNSLLTPDNWHDYDSTITRCIERIVR